MANINNLTKITDSFKVSILLYVKGLIMRRVDISGKVFGFLKVKSLDTEVYKGRRRWICDCTCGKEFKVIAYHLTAGKTVSCGCMKAVRLAKKKGVVYRGGKSKHPLYPCWRGIINRCYNPNNHNYKNYKHLDVCERWRDNETGFDNFIRDMGTRPDGHSIDRIDNNKGYSPENCRWATPEDQTRNRNNTVYVEHQGKKVTLASLCVDLEHYYQVYRRVFKQRLPLNEALECM